MALSYAEIETEHREVLLKDKPQDMYEASPKGTVPVMVLKDGAVIDESFDIMLWALDQHDPDGWLQGYNVGLIQDNDTWFKKALDRYKYPNRYPDEDCSEEDDFGALDNCLKFLDKVETYLKSSTTLNLTDYAIFPFIRQFSKVDPEMFETLPYPSLQEWLEDHLQSSLFIGIMEKHPIWTKDGTKD